MSAVPGGPDKRPSNSPSPRPAEPAARLPPLEPGAAPPPGAPGLYIHVPFCDRVCPYCDFAVQTGGPRKRAAYVRSLLREIHGLGERAGAPATSEARSDNVAGSPDRTPHPLRAQEPLWSVGQPFDSIYLGGGTPSALSAAALEEILATVREVLPVDSGAAITLEANPEDVTDDSLDSWRRQGVSCLSLGVQSFDAVTLELLGRVHTPEQAIAASERSISAGFEAVSLDLIFAVPGQSAESWRATLQHAIDLRPHHISCYELTVHERTRFYRERAQGDFAEVPDDDKAEQFFLTHRFLAGAGYPAYEVSNFARRPQFRSRHNAKYWDHTPYLGLGPSAHSFDGNNKRWWNERRLSDWQRVLEEASCAVAEQERLTSEQLVLEALALGLRTTRGLDLEHMSGRYGIDLRPANAALIDELVGRGLLQGRAGSRLTPTLEGLAMADTLAGAFTIPAPAQRRQGARG